ncbi:MAG: Hsp20 family protein [Bacteroidota bacterium]
MKVDKVLTKRLAETTNIINSLNGGSVLPTFNKTKEEDHYRLEISIPSVKADDIKVEVNGDDLMVYQNIHINAYTLPNILGVVKLSYDVARENIYAEYEDDLLVVILPFNEKSGGYQKEIEIHKP